MLVALLGGFARSRVPILRSALATCPTLELAAILGLTSKPMLSALRLLV